MAIKHRERCDLLGGVRCRGRGFIVQVKAGQVAILHPGPPPLHAGSPKPQAAVRIPACGNRRTGRNQKVLGEFSTSMSPSFKSWEQGRGREH